MKTIWLFLSAALFCAIAIGAGTDGPELKNYRIVSPHHEEIIEAVNMLVSRNSSVSFDKSSGILTVNALPDEHEAVTELLREVNVPPKNVMIEVFLSEPQIQHGASKDSTESASITVITPEKSITQTRISPSIHSGPSGKSHINKQSLLLKDGSSASLAIGGETAFAEWLISAGKQWGYIQRELITRKVGSFLKVKANIVGGGPYINITIIPELSVFTDDGTGQIEYKHMETSVTVKSGQTISIGEFSGEQADFYNKFLSTTGSDNVIRPVAVTLCATIQKP